MNKLMEIFLTYIKWNWAPSDYAIFVLILLTGSAALVLKIRGSHHLARGAIVLSCLFAEGLAIHCIPNHFDNVTLADAESINRYYRLKDLSLAMCLIFPALLVVPFVLLFQWVPSRGTLRIRDIDSGTFSPIIIVGACIGMDYIFLLCAMKWY